MKLKTIKNIKDLEGKKVILRVGLNVLGKKKEVSDALRVKKALPTIRFLKNKGAKVILLSHLTGNGTKSLKPVARFLNSYFKVGFSKEVLGDETTRKVEKMKNGDVLLLENLRKNVGEKKNSIKFARELSLLGDVFVNDAFSVSHREHASIVSLPKFLPSYAGLLMEEEINTLSKVFTPKHPFLIILGGVKFESKLGVVNRFIKSVDKIFIGGALANKFLSGKGIDTRKTSVDMKGIKKYIKSGKIILPVDVEIKRGMILDIGEKTIDKVSKLISDAKFIIWNGPLGDFENGFDKGTRGIVKAIAKSKAKSIVGGGDTVAILEQMKYIKKFSFVSTGGGAMLEFLAKGTLPGIEPLKK